MLNRLEITLKNQLFDAEGESIRKKAETYFGLQIDSIRSVHVLTLDAELTDSQLETIRTDVFTNPVTQTSSYQPLDLDFDWVIWVGYRPGVRDNAGSTAVEAIEDVLGISLKEGEAVYTSRRYCVKGDDLSFQDMNLISGEILANRIIQQWKIYPVGEWDRSTGIGFHVPKVELNHIPEVATISIDSDETLKKISDERNLALNTNDIPVIRDYFLNETVLDERKQEDLSEPTDLELEYISQARSDHCNHNTFQGYFIYRDLDTGEEVIEDNPFKKYIKEPTLKLQEEIPWVVSVLWDNAGVGSLNDSYNYTITGETHNSPSNMEAYGGAITGIVGVFRDPLGTGLSSKLVMGSYGFCVGDLEYDGSVKPNLHPRRLLDGVIEGVKDGGNKSGIPTTFGQVLFDEGYMGKSLVFVTALGIMPKDVQGRVSHEKTTAPGELIIMCGGRVGKDGIHGVTASSEVFSENTPAGHVQIGDPYTQKKMHDFILEARDEGLIEFITDNGGGGLSSSIGESAELSNGCIVDLEKVPLKYEGLDQWEIWISESQERMTVSVTPENLDKFMALSDKHAVESTVIGEYTDSGKLHIKYNGQTCAYVNIDLLAAKFPQWKFEAEWQSAKNRGLYEPVIGEPSDFNKLLKAMMARPNICSKEWVITQYDHEVQGTSVVKPLVGKNRDVVSDASVIKPVLESDEGLAFSQALLPWYSKIDSYHMTACTIDEAVRRLLSVGASLSHICGVDNFCWPDIQYHPVKNPDGKFKAAQLIRSCRALKDVCESYRLPLLSGKDSMYVDGHLQGPFGETRKLSALETIQFSAAGVIDDVGSCMTMDMKNEGDLIYILGETGDELGASEYYDLMGYTGLQVPEVNADKNVTLYKTITKAIHTGLVSSVHGVYRGGLGVHLALSAAAGGLGVEMDLSKVPLKDETLSRADVILFSESAGRFIVTIRPDQKETFEKLFSGLPAGLSGRVTGINDDFNVNGMDNKLLVSMGIDELKSAWKQPFGDMI